MALMFVESDAAQADGRALSITPCLPSCLDDGFLYALWIPAERGDDGWGASTSNAYDDWGGLTTSARGGVTARYAWRYGSKLYSVDQDNNGTAEVTYKTGGDGKRRARITAASSTWYNWDSGFTVISEESGSSGTGALTRTYVGRSLAHVDGSNPATGTWRYMYHDHLGSVRQVRDANRNLVAEYAFLPYGQMDAWSGTANATTRLFTGHDRDPLTGQDYAPYRWYSSTMNRWLSRDPLGMVDGPNVYAYVGGNPADYYDPDGLFAEIALPIAVGVGTGITAPAWLGPALIIGGIVAVAVGVTVLIAQKPQTKQVGQQGRIRRHFAKPRGRRRAEDSAQEAGKGNPPIHHGPHDNYAHPHYHPADRFGKKIPGPHYPYGGVPPFCMDDGE